MFRVTATKGWNKESTGEQYSNTMKTTDNAQVEKGDDGANREAKVAF